MKIFNLFITILFSIILISSCSDPASNDKKEEKQFLKLTLNGGEYDNYKIEQELAEYPYTLARYSDTTNSTICGTLSGDMNNSGVICTFKFPGNETGTFSNEDTFYSSYIYIVFMTLGENTTYLRHINYSLYITEYGNVGEHIAGTFSGNFTARTTTDTIAVEGEFKLIRAEDY